MALLTTYSDANKVIDELPCRVVTASYTFSQLGTLEMMIRVDQSESWRYIGMTEKAAKACQYDMIVSFAPALGDPMKEVSTDIRMVPAGGCMWEVHVQRQTTTFSIAPIGEEEEE